MAPLPPQISRYTIKSLIGRGGMGDLYLAHDPNTNRLVAIKLLNATLDSTELRERFAREARALAALNHPNIVNIYDTGEFDDSPFIVMEYVRGETLAEMIKRRAELSVAQKLRLMEELCAGLAQAHEAGIIHRDIKPANLMVDQQGRLKILDFGIARVAEDNRTRLGLPLTQVNMMIGTPGYMSPEQIEGGAVDHRSDIFAVGAVCYELLSYGEAFAGTDTRQIESRVLQAQPVPLASIVPGIDPEIDAVVFRALKRDPNKRYQDAATFEKALEHLRARLGPDGGKATVARPTPSQGAGGKVRDMRADAAYQRALDRFQSNAPDAARRFAVEALAENPSHAGARALLARLERRPVAATQVADPQPASSTVLSTSVGESADGTLVNKTVAGTSAAKTAATFASAPTIILPPTAARPQVARNRAPRVWGKDQPLRKAYEKLWQRDRTGGKRHEPAWMRYRWAGLAVLVLLIAGVMIAAIRWGVGFSTSDPLLTITKPEGGTISAVGITCGTQGTDCSVNRPKGDAIELTPQADAGFTFVGYTGDCAPVGRTIMSVSRTCGATFAKAAETAPAIGATQALTIAPVPKGGTLEGVDIICGTKGSICSVNHPDGVPVELHPTADPGFTFMGFLGDCVPLGHTQMTGPRTCSATFSPTADVSAPPVLKPSQSGAARGNRNAGGVVPAPPLAEPVAPNASASNPSAPNASATQPPPPLPQGRRGPPPTVNVDESPAGGPKPVAPPPTPVEFAKNQIQEMLKEYCDAHEALDPAAVQRLFPKVNMDALRVQLNKSKYRSVQCKISEIMFVSMDAPGGNAKVTALRKLVYEHTIQNEPLTDELAATFTMVRLGPRAQWQIETAQFRKAAK